MRNRNPKVVEILDDVRPLLACKHCGQVWAPNIRPLSGGLFYRGAWQCPNGCRAPGLPKREVPLSRPRGDRVWPWRLPPRR
jgi:hypothetical protein